MSAQAKKESSRYWWKAVPTGTRDSRSAAPTGHWWKQGGEAAEAEVCALRPRPGHLCPECGEGTLVYNGLFLLTCPECHHVAEGGANF